MVFCVRSIFVLAEGQPPVFRGPVAEIRSVLRAHTAISLRPIRFWPDLRGLREFAVGA